MNFFEKILGKILGKKKSRKKVLVLVDLENISMNTPLLFPPANFSLEKAFGNLTEKIAQEIGAIVGIFVFVPSHQATVWGEIFQRQGYFTIYCPKKKGKNGEEKDAVDDELMRFGFKMLDQMPGLDYLCLVSGDQDFVPLLQEARYHGVKNIIAAGDLQSLSKELIPLAEKDPNNPKKRRVYLLSDMGD